MKQEPNTFNMKFFIIVLSVFLISCSPTNNEDKEKAKYLLKTNIDTIKKELFFSHQDSVLLKTNIDTTKKRIIFSHQDSVEFHAIGNYYFGKMCSHSDHFVVGFGDFLGRQEIAGILFDVSIVDDGDYCYGFHYQSKEIEFRSKCSDLIQILNNKYGKPKIIIKRKKEERSDEFLSAYRTYTWNNQYKRIDLVITETENVPLLETKFDLLESIYMTITNLKLEKKVKLDKEKEMQKREKENEQKIENEKDKLFKF